jgi:tetratricopeptide (TPR) repeat protein
MPVRLAPNTEEFELLERRAKRIIARLLVRSAPVQAGEAIESSPELRGKFARAGSLYRSGRYEDALNEFLLVSREAQERLGGRSGFTAHLNVAACAAALDDHQNVIDLLQPIFQSGRLYGHPLWNLSLALYRLGRIVEASKTLQVWTSRAPIPYRGRGALLTAALLLESGDLEQSKQTLARAMEIDRAFVTMQLRVQEEPTPGPNTHRDLPASDDQIAEGIRGQLLQLVDPRRPQRLPELNLVLSHDEIETFASASEDMAEGRHEQARISLNDLCQKHPQSRYLEVALAACELFAGNNERAREILIRAVDSGERMPGSALWNLACAQIRLGDATGAIRALSECEKTEYRSKSQLYLAVGLLTNREGPKQYAQRSVVPQVGQPIQKIVRSPGSARDDVLHSLIKPRRVPPAFKPDLGGLVARDRQVIERVLLDAGSADPRNAYSMLFPLMRQYPEIYTLKVHAAAYALQSGNLSDARRNLEEAQQLKALDNYSRMNLAYLCLQDSDYRGVTQALDGLNDHTADLWLALAVSRRASQYGDASGAAARALSLCKSPQSQKQVTETLAACGIQPSSSISSEDPAVAAARAALQLLDRGDVPGCCARLEDLCGERFERVPEIGQQVFDPQFERQPDDRRWPASVIQAFQAAVRSYDDGDYQRAGDAFWTMQKQTPSQELALNAVAAYLKAEQTRRANRYAQRALTNSRRWSWKLVYNRALAMQPDYGSAVRMLETRVSDRASAIALVVALCRSGIQNPALRRKMSAALERLTESSVPPSIQLVLALALSYLSLPSPDPEKARLLISQAIERAGIQTLTPPAEVSTMQQVRTAYQQYCDSAKRAEAVQYLKGIIEAKEAQRAGLSPRQIERSLSTEFEARACLATEYKAQGNVEQTIQALDQCELLLARHANAIQPGHVSRDWLTLARLSEECNMLWAALRRSEIGLRVDPEHAALRLLQEGVLKKVNVREMELLNAAARHIVASIDTPVAAQQETVQALSQQLRNTGLLELHAPGTFKGLADLFALIIRNEDADIEERAERVLVSSRAELPSAANDETEKLIGWIIGAFAKQAPRNPVQVEIYDEEDRIWPKSYEGEACAMLEITPTGDETSDVSISDEESGKLIWRGQVSPGHPIYRRWTYESDEGFIPDAKVDLVFSVQVQSTQGVPSYPIPVTVSVASGDPVWPDYPNGALEPDLVPGGELYGRGSFIRQIVSSFGPTRARHYLIEAVRQMGKTSLLKFIKQEAPKHTLPVYVNLDEIQSDPEKNVWNCIMERVLREVGEDSAGPFHGQRHGDVVELAKRLCNKLNKAYLLLLMDEFHVLLRESNNPKGILADFRADLNEASNRISIVLADRYTLDESELRVPSEYWAQLAVEKLGPLDADSTEKAVNTPCRGTDVSFLPETTRRIFYWTAGYPFHVQRIAQSVVANNYVAGPWLTALPDDVDNVIPRMIEQDRLFQEGLCRKDRMDTELQCAIAGFLEWRDLMEIFPQLSKEPEWPEVLKRWSPQPSDLLAGFGDPGVLMGRLVAVGVMTKADGSFRFFSPLLEMWLRKMRKDGKGLHDGVSAASWGLSPNQDVANLPGPEWKRLDSELMQRCQVCGLKPPLRLKVVREELWNTLAIEVSSREMLEDVLKAAYSLLVDGREEKEVLYRFPWLTLAYHRMRLVRNFFFHDGDKPTGVALSAWSQVFSRAVGRPYNGEEARSPEEWRSIQITMLRTLQIGFRNAIELAGNAALQRGAAR